jgi:hypothetical protein
MKDYAFIVAVVVMCRNSCGMFVLLMFVLTY